MCTFERCLQDCFLISSRTNRNFKCCLTYVLDFTLFRSKCSHISIHMPHIKIYTFSHSLCCYYCLAAESCPTLLWLHGLKSSRLLHPWEFSGWSTGVGWHFLLQRIFPTQGLKLSLLNWQMGSVPLNQVIYLYVSAFTLFHVFSGLYIDVICKFKDH